MIEKDDFEAWRAHPITEAVSKALVLLAERNKQKWIDASWGGGIADPLVLADLKARAEMAQDLSELTFEELEQTLDDKPERNTAD
jgi:hypothetical protein